MNQRFAIVRTNLEPLAVETLRRAFCGVPDMASYDADMVCNESDGILCRNFSPDQAAALQANLKAEGVDVKIVDESQLPVLPPGKIIRWIQIKPAALVVEDLLKGQIAIAWEQVRLIAAGSVQLAKISRDKKVTEQVKVNYAHVLYGGVPLPHRETKVEYSAKESLDWFLRAEIILAGGAIRYSLEAEHFNFNPLGEGVTTDRAGNFCLLVQGLAAHAPKALMNRGVTAIVSDACELVYYPRKNAFLDELVWMLWRAQEKMRE